jgi:hypothetical protein
MFVSAACFRSCSRLSAAGGGPRTYVAVILVILGSGVSPLSQGTTSEDAALATVRTFVRANETADLELMLSTFGDEATVFFPGERPQRASGKAEIRESSRISSNNERVRSQSHRAT